MYKEYKILSWNNKSSSLNNTVFPSINSIDNKFDFIIIQELVQPNENEKSFEHEGETYNLLEWIGLEVPKKRRQPGIAVYFNTNTVAKSNLIISQSDSKLEGLNIEKHGPTILSQFTYNVLPFRVRINESFFINIVAVWNTENKNKCRWLTYSGQTKFLLDSLIDDAKYIICGDFNVSEMKQFETDLRNNNLVSLYHKANNVAFGSEIDKTWYIKQKPKSHVDYFLVSKSLNVTSFILADKTPSSDHRAMYCSVQANNE